jgi:hypothetical protein
VATGLGYWMKNHTADPVLLVRMPDARTLVAKPADQRLAKRSETPPPPPSGNQAESGGGGGCGGGLAGLLLVGLACGAGFVRRRSRA